MVVFTCFYCGEPIKKPSVAKHYKTKCRGAEPNLSCVDCFKDFKGNAYEAHTKCITEEERYAEAGFVPKPSSNKGEKKQQTWFESVQGLIKSNKNLKPDERELLQILANHENLPRKKKKFLNFLANAHRNYARRQDLVERVWNIIEEVGKKKEEKEETNLEKKESEEANCKNEETKLNGTKKDSTFYDAIVELIGTEPTLYKFLKKLPTVTDDLKSIQKKIKLVKNGDQVLLNFDKLK